MKAHELAAKLLAGPDVPVITGDPIYGSGPAEEVQRVTLETQKTWILIDDLYASTKSGPAIFLV